MKKPLIVLGLSLCLLGCNDATETKASNHSIFIQFDNSSSQWRGFEVNNNTVSWFSSLSCDITVSEPLSVSLKYFELDESGDIPVYSHPSLGEFVPVATLDEKAIYAAMKSGNKLRLWNAVDYDRINKCPSLSQVRKFNL